MSKRHVFLLIFLLGLGLAIIVAWKIMAAFSVHQPQVSVNSEITYPVETGEPITPLPESISLDANKVALGNRLFHDTRLSKDNSVACATCHVLSKGGVDGLPRSLGVGGQEADINAPTVFNSGFNFKQFWNGRAASLEDQIDGPTSNPKELGSGWPEIISKLRQDEYYVSEFSKIYGDFIQPNHVKDAIATFERSLITPNSRFDRYLKGDRHALAPKEIEGYQKFKSYGCIACHQGVNVGGNMYERLGIMDNYFKDRGNITPADLGRFNVTGNMNDAYVFKVPSLRNVALTAPYFHDGSAITLGQAVVTMGKYQLGILIPSDDVSLIVMFLHSLTGEYNGKPL
jgi:cytochrome c peroxidase